MNENLDQLREEMRTHAGLGWDHQPVAFEVLEALIDRVEAAEAAVQRVREIAKADLKCPCCSGYEEILRALDGGEQE